MIPGIIDVNTDKLKNYNLEAVDCKKHVIKLNTRCKAIS